jgi:tripartite-type tricarboxylate transporter receptor subunit TctC
LRMRRALSLLPLLFVAMSRGLHAEPYPDKLIRIVVPFTAGATTDVMARLIAAKITDEWKVPVIVDNKPGASGIVGAQYVAKTAPDGYNLIMVTDSHISLPNMFRSVPFDPIKDFTPIVMLGRAPNVFVVNPATKVNTIQELVAYARAHPGELSYGSAGPGGSNHMTAELFKLQANAQIQHIAYKGGAPNALAVAANEVPMSVSLLPTIDSFVKTGKVRALAITSATRNPAMPNVPTLAESGFPGFESYEWWALLGPAGMPPEIVNKLNAEFDHIMKLPDVRERMATIGIEYNGGGTPAQTTAYMKAELEKWAKVANSAGIKPE